MNLCDAYRFILIDNSLVKLFASWDGAFAIGEQWQLNSGCVQIFPRGDVYDVLGYSGSIYRIRNEQGSLNSYTRMMYDKIVKQLSDAGVPVKEISLQQVIDILEESK